MKKTFRQLLEIDNVIGDLYKKTPELKDSKFGYAYKRFYDKNLDPMLKKYKERMADIAVEYALEDKTTHELLTDDKNNYKYSKEGRLALHKAQREYGDQIEMEEVEVEPYISTYTPSDLSDIELEILEGSVIEAPKKKAK